MSGYKRKIRRNAAHKDDWLMTYSDMITLLLCFFIVFLPAAIAARKAPAPQIVESAVQAPQSVAIAEIEQLEPRAEFLQAKGEVPFEEPLLAKEKTSAPETPEVSKVEETLAQTQSSAEITKTPSLSQIVEDVKKAEEAHIEEKGDRLTSIEMSSASFFDSGSATISNRGADILRAVATNLEDEKYKDFQITVEGHTDDTPINTPQFPSNWELSTARASAVVKFFLNQGLSAQRLRASGYADTFPKVANRDVANRPIPANQLLNRRVVIRLEKIDKIAAR